ncbi:unnamed protein product [Prunus armeniaca]|uniref:Protein GAMETE EXPRESSED 3 n=1 Tax=Prunus armeniaca TaxID=36596 RepID=A0A6J5UGV5_PRUAR|nr:unnamed protein product [Prunus armeniaca]
MAVLQSFVFLFLMVSLASTHSQSTQFQNYPAKEPTRRNSRRLSRPLIGHDGKVYTCSEKDLLAFESNGSIAWTMHLNYTCNSDMPPVHGGRRKIYLVADNRVIKINLLNNGTSEPAAEVLLSAEPTKEGQGGIVGLAVSTMSSSVFVNIKNRGLFAYMTRGQLLWSAGPVIDLFGYRQGCRKNSADCFFNSVPVIDECEASIYISNTGGELYSLSIRHPHFKWIQDLSSYDKVFTITPGNNGRLYVTVPVKALLLALDVSSGNVLWEGSIGPLSTADYAPVVDSNGWISIGSLDGFLYSFSPTGVLKKFSRTAVTDSVIQVSPTLDCTGFAIYISQTEMEGKISRTVGEYTYVSAMKPKSVLLTLYVPATGSIYWSESYPGQFSSFMSQSDLCHFILDERILLAFVAASKTGNPLACRSTRQKLMSSCSQVRPKLVSIYTGNERAILWFLLFESAIMVVLAGLVRFCCIFWSKKKLKGENLGSFLEKRRSLRLKKKAFDRTITELEQKAAVEAMANEEVLEKLGNLLQKREGIERKLSTTYSLGRDGGSSRSKTLLPLYDRKTRSYYLQGGKKESVAVFHTLSDTSTSIESSSGGGEAGWTSCEDKGKAPLEEEESSSDGGFFTREYKKSPSEPASSSRGLVNPLLGEKEWTGKKLHYEDEVDSEPKIMIGSRSLSLKRRRALSSTN